MILHQSQEKDSILVETVLWLSLSGIWTEKLLIGSIALNVNRILQQRTFENASDNETFVLEK